MTIFKYVRLSGWIAFLAGCATIPAKRYGVEHLHVDGMRQMDENALKACLAQTERTNPSLDLSANPDPVCGAAPFDAKHVKIPIWGVPLPWTDWSLYDRSIFQRDLDRVARWYQARGFYDTRVTNVSTEPAAAMMPGAPFIECPNSKDGEGCPLHVHISVDEGNPILTRHVSFQGLDALPTHIRNKIERAPELEIGTRFDESDYELAKARILHDVRDASFAKATIKGDVEIDKILHSAHVVFTVTPGPPCYFGNTSIRVRGERKVPGAVIVRAAGIQEGAPFSLSAIAEAEQAIYRLGALSSVQVEPKLDGASHTIPVEINVIAGRYLRYGLGGGSAIGNTLFFDGFNITDVKQWDFHLLGFIELRNAFGGLQKLRIEERPRLIFTDTFPHLTTPKFGNVLSAQAQFPSFIEGRTTLSTSTVWDLGPDPYGRTFSRNVIDINLAAQRSWRIAGATLFGSVGVHENLFQPYDVAPGTDVNANLMGNQEPIAYRVFFLEQYSSLDFRDNPKNPRKGVFFGLSLHEALMIPGISSWTYIRMIPDVRGYVPLPLGIVFAGRVRFGGMFILNSSSELDYANQTLGPEVYRLRGGGPTSNRGFTPGQLGDSGTSLSGGIRRWEASAELRIRLGTNWGGVLFLDTGDVIDIPTMIFYRPQASTGLGVRYRLLESILVRMDFGFRIPGLQQVAGNPHPLPTFPGDPITMGSPLVFNFGIGEAF